MAGRRRSSSSPPEPVPKQFSSFEEIERGITKLRRRLEEVERVDPAEVSYDDAAVDTVESNISNAILEIFGPASPEYREHQYHRIWKGSMIMGMSRDYAQQCFSEGLPQTQTMLQGLIDRLEEKKLDFAPQQISKQRDSTSRRVFVGHGAAPLWMQLKEFLTDRLKLGYEEFNRESPAGYTHKERLEQMLDSTNFAFLVMTAEDQHSDATQHARENVVHEVGLFQGRHGFQKAIVLLEEGCEEFSNIHGLNQIRFPPGDIMACSEEIRRVLEREGII